MIKGDQYFTSVNLLWGSVKIPFQKTFILTATFLVTAVIYFSNGQTRKTGWVQGWNSQDVSKWYNLSQGSRLIPRKWFDSLNSPSGYEFSSRQSLSQYGYRYEDIKSALPIGFTQEQDDRGQSWVGMNCSACHTSHLKNADTEIVIHGGQTMADFQLFVGELIEVVSNTRNTPEKLAKFQVKILGREAGAKAKTLLLSQMDKWLALRKRVRATETGSTRWGRGRADAVGIILSTAAIVVDPNATERLPISNAPVSYPFIWNANQQALLQHNGVISNGVNFGPFNVAKPGALTRNWVEVFGVFAAVEVNEKTLEVNTSINLESLMELEQILARLESPQWPKVFGSLNKQRRSRGKKLYDTNCVACHSVVSPEDIETPIILRSDLTTPIKGPYIYMQPIVDLSVTSRRQSVGVQRSKFLIGTDPVMACNSALHTVPTGMLKGQPKVASLRFTAAEETFGEHAISTDILGALFAKDLKPRLKELGKAYLKDQTEGALALLRSSFKNILPKGYGGSSYDPELSGTPIDQFLAACADATVKANLINSKSPLPVYKARPLNGIWATAPYLHNGSVPTLDDLLKPQAQRPSSFGYLDGAYDTEKVGLLDRRGEKGATIQEVYNANGQAILGNWNGGHAYGTQLKEAERQDLIEYVKGL